MFKIAILSVGILSSGTNQNVSIVQDNLQLQKAKSNLAAEKVDFLNSHNLNIQNLEKNLKVIYNHQLKNLKNLKDGRDGWKHHWYGYDLWVSNAKGSTWDNAILNRGTIDALNYISEGLEQEGMRPADVGAAFIKVAALLLMSQWAIVWSATNEGDGVHISVETLTGVQVVVYAHAQ